MLLQRAISFFRGSPAGGGDPPRKPNQDGLPTTFAEAGLGYASKPSPQDREQADAETQGVASEAPKSSRPPATPFPPVPPWQTSSTQPPPPKHAWVHGPSGWHRAADDEAQGASSASSGEQLGKNSAGGEPHEPKAAAAAHLDLRECWRCGEISYLRKGACVNIDCATWLHFLLVCLCMFCFLHVICSNSFANTS